MHFKDKGFTLVELLIFIAVSALVIAVAYQLYDKTNSSKKINNEVRSFSQFVEKLDKITLASNYAPISNGTLDIFGLNFKSEFEQPAISNNGSNQLVIRYFGLSRKDCTDFTTKTTNQLNALNKFIARVNGNDMQNNPVFIATACGASDNNTIEFVFNTMGQGAVNVAQSSLPQVSNPPLIIPTATTPVVIPSIVVPPTSVLTMPHFPVVNTTPPVQNSVTRPVVTAPSISPAIITVTPYSAPLIDVLQPVVHPPPPTPTS
jgi:prepilin-type N-terminal cleavage/methylation domain-containing protein